MRDSTALDCSYAQLINNMQSKITRQNEHEDERN